MDIKLTKISGHEKSAKVGKILAKEGQSVAAGDVLINLESNKGNVKIKSEVTGTILKICVSEGDTVKIGDVLFEADGKQEAAEKETAPKKGYSFGLAKPQKEDLSCDIAILGGGPGGYVAAIRAAQLGASVVLIEENRVGGTCLNRGCIPTKSFVRSAHIAEAVKEGATFGIKTAPAEIDLAGIVDRKNDVVDTLVGGIEHLLENGDVRTFIGKGFIENGKIRVQNKRFDATIDAAHVIFAMGSSPAMLNIPGADSEKVLTSTELLDLKTLPKRLTIVGGGVIGMEFAFIFNTLGTEVTVVEFLDDILFTMDEDVIDVIKDACRERGIRLHTRSRVNAILTGDDGSCITEFIKGDAKEYTVGDYVLMAVGRRANLGGFDFEGLGIALNERKNGIAVDAAMKTTNDQFYAIGDVTNIIQLAHVASHQGVVAVENIMGQPTEMHYDAIPSAVFISPEIGSVGLSEKAAKAKNIPYKTGIFPFAANGKAQTLGETDGFVKVLAHAETDKIIGASIVGPGATDMISNFTVYIEKGFTAKDLAHTIFAHPTTAESVHEAVLALGSGSIHYV